jgi:pteridine reductase
VRRLGRYISYHLAENGYDLAIIYNKSSVQEIRKTQHYLQNLNIKFNFYKCDLTNLSKLKDVIGQIVKDFKKIDLLMNNAGVIEKIKFENIKEKNFDLLIDTNLRAPFFASQYCIPYLKKTESPVIINIASLGGIQNWKGFIPYSISKNGMIKLTKLLAKELAPEIRVNAIAPGTIEIQDEKAVIMDKISKDKIPLERYGTPDDIIAGIDFILNCEYLTGEVITIDGGRTL